MEQSITGGRHRRWRCLVTRCSWRRLGAWGYGMFNVQTNRSRERLTSGWWCGLVPIQFRRWSSSESVWIRGSGWAERWAMAPASRLCCWWWVASMWCSWRANTYRWTQNFSVYKSFIRSVGSFPWAWQALTAQKKERTYSYKNWPPK